MKLASPVQVRLSPEVDDKVAQLASQMSIAKSTMVRVLLDKFYASGELEEHDLITSRSTHEEVRKTTKLRKRAVA